MKLRPRLLARYLLVSCYCHLNELQKAHTVLGYLEKAVGMQPTTVNTCLLAAAKTEYAACQQKLRGTGKLSEESEEDAEELAKAISLSCDLQNHSSSSRGDKAE